MPNIWDIFDANPGGATQEGGPKMIGHKAVSAALAQGISIGDINAALEQAGDRVAESNRAGEGSLAADLASTGTTSRWGTHDTEAEQSAHVGTADVNFMRQQGQSWTDIANYMGDKTNISGLVQDGQANEMLWNTIGDVQAGATGEAITAATDPLKDKVKEYGGQITDLGNQYSSLQGSYDTLKNKYDAMGTQYTNLQADVAQAAKDALKIKYTGSTAVQNPSAMGIQAAQGTPFRGSGLAGTAALARPNKGLKIKTLNV